MKKIFTLCVLLAAALTGMAQDATFQFVDQSGNAVGSGATLTLTELTEDPFGVGVYISSGLSVKNVSGDNAQVRVAYQVEAIDNGDFQICFPVNCISKSETGSFTTEKGPLASGEVKSLQCEWLPAAYGTCKATLTVEVLSALGSKLADGPTVHLVFRYADPASVNSISSNAAVVTGNYNLQGQSVAADHRGITVSRLSDGRTVKHIQR